MANSLGTNPIVIDTAGTTILRSNPTFVRRISWQGYTSSAHAVVVTDAAGTQVLSSTGKTDLTPVDLLYSPSASIRGLKVTTLGSGKVLVFLE